MPYLPRYEFRLPYSPLGMAKLTAGSFRFLGYPVPARDFCLGTLGLPNNDGIVRTLSGFPRSARGGDMIALGLLFTPRARCS